MIGNAVQFQGGGTYRRTTRHAGKAKVIHSRRIGEPAFLD